MSARTPTPRVSAADASAAMRDLSEQLRSEEGKLFDEESSPDSESGSKAESHQASVEEIPSRDDSVGDLFADETENYALHQIEAEDGSGSALTSVLSWIVASLAVAALVWLLLNQLFLEAVLTAIGAFFLVSLLQVLAHVVRLQEQQRWALLQLLALQREQSFTQHQPQTQTEFTADSFAD